MTIDPSGVLVAMQNEKEAFESSINGLAAFLEDHHQNCRCFEETEIEKKIHEIETLNAHLDAKFLTLQNISENNNVKPHEIFDFYSKLGHTRNNIRTALAELKDGNDLIKFLKIDIQHHWLKKIQSALLINNLLTTQEKIMVWCGALERSEKENSENLELKEVLYKEIILLKKRFMKASDRSIAYEEHASLFLQDNQHNKDLDTLQHLFSMR